MEPPTYGPGADPVKREALLRLIELRLHRVPRCAHLSQTAPYQLARAVTSNKWQPPTTREAQKLTALSGSEPQ
ncbi:hypothetical protein NDU88_011897 [Pleurodeles waltl]|uniref:Uncharacterized protein n=1 Tax=Pleurodeles waltl TaxID=8319 RepID=A0AAV7QYM7_PLEWA|nr:hypothetical protein NDU88_011897 [Pleurodeles waltl]